MPGQDTAVKELAHFPMFYHVILHLLHCFGKTVIESQGVQQGDLLGPLLLSCYS